MHYCTKTLLATVLFLFLLASAGAASELIYEPTNPSFGGDPLNGSFLLNKAQSQNHFEDDFGFNDDPIAEFEETLTRRLLSGLASQITEAIFGEETLPEGPITVGDLQIEVLQGAGEGGQTLINITNTLTGEITILEVPTI